MLHGLPALVREPADSGGGEIGIDGVGSTLANLVARVVNPAHARLGGEGHEGRIRLGELATTQAKALLGQDHDRAALGRLVGEGRQLCSVGELLDLRAVDGNELVGAAVAKRDGASLVEHEHVHVAGGLDGATAHGEHVCLVEAAHSRDADGGEKGADGRGGKAHEQGHERGDRAGIGHTRLNGREVRVGIERHHHEDEDNAQRHEEHLERNFVGGLLARGTLDHGNHLVEEALARIIGDLDHDPVGEHGRDAHDGATVSARLANHGRRFAGYGAFVDRGGAHDHRTVSRNLLACVDDHEIVLD